MSDIYSDIIDDVKKKRQACRVAYTLNNSQPVLCTIIDEQPLFYMDHESSHYEDEEDMFFDAADMGILENELNTLKKELERFDSFASQSDISSQDKMSDFFECSADITQDKSVESASDLNALIEVLNSSRLAKAYLECAQNYNVEIKLSDQIETSFYDREAGIILIQQNIDFVEQLILCVQELRRHWQHRQGALIHPLTFHPDNAVLVNRAQVADLAVSVVRCAWELQLSGYKAVWERIENSSFADLGRAFAREAYLDFRTLNNGQAMAAVFEGWFLSERCRAQDKLLINQMLNDHQGYVFDMKEVDSALTPALISALGAMPFGKNYLAEHAMTIIDDAIFTDVRDRSNANFLWFVKFERTFRETEQELQTSSASSPEGFSSFDFQTDTQDTQNGPTQQQSADIITFQFSGSDTDVAEKGQKQKRRLSPRTRSKRSDDQESLSNVVYLRSWSGEY